jgi:hypothetical protein
MVTPFRLVPNDLDELNPLSRSFFETAAAVAIQQMVTGMENGIPPVCEHTCRQCPWPQTQTAKVGQDRIREEGVRRSTYNLLPHLK